MQVAELEHLLLKERDEVVAQQIRSVQLEEQRDALEAKTVELQQALEEFVRTTDKNKESEEQPGL